MLGTATKKSRAGDRPSAEQLLAEALTDFSGELDLGRGRFWGLAFSRDGRNLAYARQTADGLCTLTIAERSGHTESFPLAEGELLSEVHGFCEDGRHVVFTVAPGELRVLDRGTGVMRHLAMDLYFAGFDDVRGGITAWARASGTRLTFHISFDGAVEERNRARLDRGYVRSADGRRAFVADKVSADPSDRRFRIFEASSLWDAEARLVAELVIPGSASRVKLDVSPDGSWVHVSAVGSVLDDVAKFDLVVATDDVAAHRLAPLAWLAGGRALLDDASGALAAVDLTSATRTPFLAGPVEHTAVTKDGTRVAYVRRGRLRVMDVRR